MKSTATSSDTTSDDTTVTAWSPKICPAMPCTKTIGANTETVVIAELDLNDLAVQRDIGSVKPLQDERRDLYAVTTTIQVETVQVR